MTGSAATAPQRAGQAQSIAEIDALVSQCQACPRLVAWREEVAHTKRASFRDQTYWGRGVPGFGPVDARILVVGLAPAAHGANRTGRMFTGDRSGDFLFAAMHAVGLANQSHAVSADDGLALSGVRITSPVHCAPPANKPTPAERRTCAPFLNRELELLADTLRVAVVLGGFGWQALMSSLADGGWAVPRPRPKFGHGVSVVIDHPDGRTLTVIGCFHVSQQNTFTGRLTQPMLQGVLREAMAAAGLPSRQPAVVSPVLAAGAVIVDEAGRVLLVKRGHDPEKGHWSVPGGHVEPGETLTEAVAREVLEETGLRVDVGAELWCVTVDYEDADTFEIHDFAATVTGGRLRAGDDADEARWVTAEQMESLPLVAALRQHLTAAGLVPPTHREPNSSR